MYRGNSYFTWHTYQRVTVNFARDVSEEIVRQQAAFFDEQATFDAETEKLRLEHEERLQWKRANLGHSTLYMNSNHEEPFSPITAGPTADFRGVVAQELQLAEAEAAYAQEMEKRSAEFAARAERAFPLATLTPESQFLLAHGFHVALRRNLVRVAAARQALAAAGEEPTAERVLAAMKASGTAAAVDVDADADRVGGAEKNTPGALAKSARESSVKGEALEDVGDAQARGGKVETDAGGSQRVAIRPLEEGDGAEAEEAVVNHPREDAPAAADACGQPTALVAPNQPGGKRAEGRVLFIATGGDSEMSVGARAVLVPHAGHEPIGRGALLQPAPPPLSRPDVLPARTALLYLSPRLARTAPWRRSAHTPQDPRLVGSPHAPLPGSAAELLAAAQPLLHTFITETVAGNERHMEQRWGQREALLRAALARAESMATAVANADHATPAEEPCTRGSTAPKAARASAGEGLDPHKWVAALRAELETVAQQREAYAASRSARHEAVLRALTAAAAGVVHAGEQRGLAATTKPATMTPSASARACTPLSNPRSPPPHEMRQVVPVASSAPPAMSAAVARRVLEGVAKLPTATTLAFFRAQPKQSQESAAGATGGGAAENCMETFLLPAETPDTDAYLARQYLWPAELEAGIAHQLCATLQIPRTGTQWMTMMLSAANVGDIFAHILDHEIGRGEELAGLRTDRSGSANTDGEDDRMVATAMACCYNAITRPAFVVDAVTKHRLPRRLVAISRTDFAPQKETAEDLAHATRKRPRAGQTDAGADSEDDDGDDRARGERTRSVERGSTEAYAKRLVDRRFAYARLPRLGDCALLIVAGAGEIAASSVTFESVLATPSGGLELVRTEGGEQEGLC